MGRDFITFTENTKEKAEVKFVLLEGWYSVCFQGGRAVLSCVWAAVTLAGPERQDSRKLRLLNVFF